MVFAGFSAEDFETYEPARRTSAMYTLQRRAVKDKLTALAAQAGAVLGEQLAGLQEDYSDEAPGLVNNRRVDSQWLTWLRGPEAQQKLRALQDKIQLSAPDALDIAPHHKHAHLAVVVDDRRLETSLRIHRRAQVDRDNLTTRLKESWAREAVAEHLNNCGAGFSFGAVEGRDLPETPVAEADAAAVQRWLDAGAESEWLVVSASCSIDDATALGAQVGEACAERLAPLLALYRFVAWSPDNDHVGAKKAIKEIKAEAKKSGFKKGDGVRILAGMWQGRRGTVEGVDKKGGLKVTVGLVTVKVDASEVASA